MKAAPLSQTIVQNRKRKGSRSRQPDAVQCSDDLNRLLSAAVINKNFCRKLLASPLAAIAEGYCGYFFDLPEQETNILAMIRSVSLDDFARQLISRLTISQHPVGNSQYEQSKAGELEYSMVPVIPNKPDYSNPARHFPIL